MERFQSACTRCLIILAAIAAAQFQAGAADTLLLGWNNIGMHWMDSDYSLFGISPPFNTIQAQLIVGGKLVTNATGLTVTYEAIADPTGSINSTSAGKTTFYEFAPDLFGINLSADAGLGIYGMRSEEHTPEPMFFQQTDSVPVNWFRAE